MTRPRQEPRRTARCGSPVGALIAVAILAGGCGGAEAPSCPAGEPIEIDLDAWRRQIDDAAEGLARGADTYDPLLAQIGLGPLPETSGDGPTPEDAAMKPGSVEIRPLRLGGAAPHDWLVAVRFRNAAGAEALRAQLLRPVLRREHVYCPLGDELSHDKAPFEEPCLEPHAGPARTLEPEPLVEPGRDALVVRDAGGWCGPGTSRGDRRVTSFWGVEEDRLARYLEVVTFEAWYESPAPPVEVRSAGIELGAGWPRTIAVTEVVECPVEDPWGEEDEGAAAPGAPPADAGDCRPSERSTLYHYENGRYAALDTPPPGGAPAGETSASEEETS